MIKIVKIKKKRKKGNINSNDINNYNDKSIINF